MVMTYFEARVDQPPARHTRWYGFCLLAAATVLAACGSDDPAAPTISVSSVTVDLTTATLAIGGSVQLTATARDAAGNVVSTTVAWSSNDAAVATVNSTGLVTAVAAGTAAITATAEGHTGAATVVVEAAPAIGLSLLTSAVIAREHVPMKPGLMLLPNW